MRPSRSLFAAQSRLLRDFINDSLYNLQHGYFSKQAPVGFLNPPIDFSTLRNRAAYLAQVQHHYTALQVAWLTPVEIFSPHYGAALAHYLTTQHISNTSNKPDEINNKSGNNKHPLVVYEIGGGTGTLAKDILNWLKQYRPEVHSTCQYTCIEISPTLADLQYQRVVVEQQGIHENQFHVVRGDASEIDTWQILGKKEKAGEEEACFVVAMEVLDNLPHDKVIYNFDEKENDTSQFLETFVTEADDTTSSVFQESYQPVSDPLIHRCLQTWLDMEDATTDTMLQKEEDRNFLKFSNKNKGFLENFINTASAIIDHGSLSSDSASNSSIFLPTGALQLFDTLHTVRPNHRLLAADFDFLPETVIQGKNAPLVATTKDGVTRDYGSYLVQPGVADIFFPSDFELSSRLYDHSRSSCGRREVADRTATRHLKSKDFFKKWAEVEREEGGGKRATRLCQDGYDPLVEDYSNTAFLVS